MAQQPSVASFFNTRKRAAPEDIASIKNKRLFEVFEPIKDDTRSSADLTPKHQQNEDSISLKLSSTSTSQRTRSGRTVKRISSQPHDHVEVLPKKVSKIEQNTKQQQKLVQFIRKGPMSPRNKATLEIQKSNEATPTMAITAFASKNNAQNMERGMKTPTKQIIKNNGTPLKPEQLKSLVKKELNFDEVKKKISRSDKLKELKESLARVQELEKARLAQEERNRRLRKAIAVSPGKKIEPVVQLKEFDTIELEVLTSPAKSFKTPTKLPPPTPDKNELMSPRHTNVSKRILFSPAKKGSPSKQIVPPAYQRFMSLAETTKAGQLPLPFKYRHLIEIFKAVDSVCAMFHNRKECITFKKLKPAAQRMLRKNITETHLAQIKHLYPEAFHFTQMKMRNYGSISKADYFQLIISPNVAEGTAEAKRSQQTDEDNVLAAAQCNAMNPHVMTMRLRHFQNLLLQRALDAHEKFLKSLDPPLSIAKEKVTRWHPDFDLETSPNIECAPLPQPPNVEKYSSARDILSTARNLFNCATPMERAMERYDAKLETDRIEEENSKISTNIGKATMNDAFTNENNVDPESLCTAPTQTAPPISDFTATLLKGVPKSLLEKIRAKQAAKALDAMTRRPSQDQEACKYSRLPELARHLRNVFITERKGVLTVEAVIKKIQNSFRTSLTQQEIEAHLKLLCKEVPAWLSFHEVRKTMYLKITKDMDLIKVMQHLEEVANAKSK